MNKNLKALLKIVILAFLFTPLAGCSYHHRKNCHQPWYWHKRVTEVEGVYIYDFEGYFTEVTNNEGYIYPTTTNGIDDCKPLSSFCMRKEGLWICACHDESSGNGNAVNIIVDKTQGEK